MLRSKQGIDYIQVHYSDILHKFKFKPLLFIALMHILVWSRYILISKLYILLFERQLIVPKLLVPSIPSDVF